MTALAAGDGAWGAAPRKARKAPARKQAKRVKPAGKRSPKPLPASEATLIEARLKRFSLDAMRRAIADMTSALPAGKAPQATPETLKLLARYEKALPEVQAGLARKDASAVAEAREILDFQAKVLLGNLFRMDCDGGAVRQWCFDQDHNWYPTMMPDGNVLYTRWQKVHNVGFRVVCPVK